MNDYKNKKNTHLVVFLSKSAQSKCLNFIEFYVLFFLISSSFRFVFYMVFQPFVLFPKHVQNGFFSHITMTLLRQHYQSYRSSQPFQSIKITLTLQRIGARVVIGFAMD